MQNKSVLNKEQERESRSYSLFNTDLSCTKGGQMQQSYKIELKKIAIHPDHKKIEFSRKGIYRIKIAAKNNVGTEVNSKK